MYVYQQVIKISMS